MVQRRRRLCAGVVLLLAGLPACKKATPSEPSVPLGPPVQTNTVTITAAGVNPNNIEIALGTRVRFVNNDTRSHNMGSDPHPDHTDCPEINQIGFLLPGQSRETGNFVVPRSCGYHDHDLPNSNGLKGRIVSR